MSFILNHPLPPGGTPLSPEDTQGLIPSLGTIGEVNEYETLNILEAKAWVFKTQTMAQIDPLSEPFVRKLHFEMYGQVWKWAGKYRTHGGLSLGCDPHEILQRLPQLLENTKYWLEHQTYPIDECVIRFHHKLVGTIHPFPNGNGRHARMIADVIAAKNGRPAFTWGQNANLVTNHELRARYIEALHAADANENDIQPLLEFARS